MVASPDLRRLIILFAYLEGMAETVSYLRLAAGSVPPLIR